MAVIQIVPEGTTGAFTPYGGVREFMESTDPQVFVCGGADSGKSTGACYKTHMLAMLFPGCRIAILRKSYRALVNSVFRTYERVLRETGYNNQVRLVGGTKPEQFIYPYSRNEINGRVFEGESSIILGNLDRSSDHLGAEYDFVYVNQPEEISLEDWEYLTTRANGRNNGASYYQLFGDPNPAESTHWIKTGADEGRWKLIKSTFKDNPTIWDMKNDKLSEAGKKRLEPLMKLTGARRQRLFDGEWVSREGLVYGDVWDNNVHVINRFEVPASWKRYWAIDWGFDHPAVCEMFAENPATGDLFRYREFYISGRTTEQFATQIKNLTFNDPAPSLIVTDRDSGSGSHITFENITGFQTTKANKSPGSIISGIDVMTESLRFEPRINGKTPDIYFMQDSLVEVDQRLKSLKQPLGFEEEIVGYQWDSKTVAAGAGMPKKGQPDHSLDAVRYLLSMLRTGRRVVPAFIWV